MRGKLMPKITTALLRKFPGDSRRRQAGAEATVAASRCRFDVVMRVPQRLEATATTDFNGTPLRGMLTANRLLGQDRMWLQS